jgi:Flp pilus assembly protein TadD
MPLLLQGMVSEDPLRRWAAAQDAGELINEASDEIPIATGLQKLLEDPVRAVRVAAAWGLRRNIDEEHSAAVELMEFLLLNADQPAGALQLGTWFFDRGQGDRAQLKVALGWIEKAANWDAGSAVALHGCAVVKSALGDSKGARKLLERAVKLQPVNVPWLYGLALAVHEDGDLARAERLLVKVCRLAPDHLRARYNLALAQVALGRVDNGLKSMGEAIRRAPQNLDFLMARVAILRDAGRMSDALVRMREVVALYPRNRNLLGALREFLLATGDKRGAAEIERQLSRLP